MREGSSPSWFNPVEAVEVMYSEISCLCNVSANKKFSKFVHTEVKVCTFS